MSTLAEGTAREQTGTTAEDPVRVLVVSNVLAGYGDAGIYDLVHALGQRDCEVVLRYFNGRGRLADLVHDAEAFDRVVAGGGDGTASALAYALRECRTPLLLYPSGTANLIASNLRMPADPQALADITLSGRCLDLDIGELTHLGSSEPLEPHERRGFMVAAGAGFDASLMEAAQALKPAMGVLAYFAAVMQNLTPTRAAFRVVLDGREMSTEGIAVLVVNISRLQFDLSITHDSNPTDGCLEVALLRSRTAVGLLPALWDAILDRVVQRPERGPLEIESAREILVESDPPLRLQYDGEAVEFTTPFGVRVLPGAAHLLVPEATERAFKGGNGGGRPRGLVR